MTPDEFARLKSEPPTDGQALIKADDIKLDKKVNIAGFYVPAKKPNTKENEEKQENTENALSDNLQEKLNIDCNNNTNDENKIDLSAENADCDDDDDQTGWITPNNLDVVKRMNNITGDEQVIDEMQIQVGCMTSDFSMQNVLMQIGIAVLSVDGLLIKKPRSYVLKCITCSRITTDMLRQFCKNCGYKSLERVVVTIDENGNKVYRGRRKTPSAKSLIHSLPMPRGGKHSNYPILSEDQPRAQQLPSKKSQIKNDPLDPDYATYNSPFVTKDVNSRSARLGIKHGQHNRFNKRN